MEIIFWFFIITIFYTYIGYYLLLYSIVLIFPTKTKGTYRSIEYYPEISIIIAVYNGEKKIDQRIKNLLELNYPKEKIEIIIASDGSNDRTIDVANKHKELGVKVLIFKEHRGRALVHNDAVKIARGEMIVFTDIDTKFNKDFLLHIIKPFSNHSVGCVTGNLNYITNRSSISKTEGFYFNFEKKVREFESHLGILVSATGACMAIRRTAWKELSPIDDCDFTTPIDIVLQGYKVVFAKEAIAYDIPPDSIKKELLTRVRMTSKNLVGTFKRWGIMGFFKYPLLGWNLFSHKLLRWFAPFLFVGVFLCNLFLLKEKICYQFIFEGQIVFYFAGLVGLIGEFLEKQIFLASSILSFCVANLGIGIGVIKGLLGKIPARY